MALDVKIRDTANDIKKNLGELVIDMSLRKDAFARIVAFSKTEEAKHMDMENKRWIIIYSLKLMLCIRYLEKTMKQGRRNGLELAETNLEEFKIVKKKISELGIK